METKNSSSQPLIQLDQAQRQAVASDGVTLVFAGAGSGKTRTLVFKLGDVLLKGFTSEKILALTFTNKAAQEMKERTLQMLRQPQFGLRLPASRLRHLASKLFVGTFHSWGAKFLRQEVSVNLTIYDEEDSLAVIKQILKEIDLDLEPKFIQDTISYAKNRLVKIEEFDASDHHLERAIAQVWKLYDQRLRANNAFDFDDLMLCPLKLLQTNPQLQNRYQYQYVLVDEFQDTNLPQYLLVKLLVEKHRNLFVVGDDYQSIYSWRAADYRHILKLQQDFSEVTTFILGHNYRSTKKIVESANQLILNNKFQKHKELWTNNDQGSDIIVYEAYNEDEEAGLVADLISDLLTRSRPAEIAVLYRLNFLSRALEEKLLLKQIPYKIYGGVHFYQRKEIKDVIAYARILANPRDLISFKRIINVPARGIGPKAQEKIFSLAAPVIEKGLREKQWPEINSFLKVYDQLQKLYNENLPLSEFFKSLIDITGYLTYIREDLERVQNVSELVNVASNFDDRHFEAAFQAFLDLTSLWQAQDEFEQQEKVQLMSIHLAKGLEFKTVFIVGMEETIFPHHKSVVENDEGLEEERRLAYVALTRAKEQIYITHTKRRRYWGRFIDAAPSRFLKELPQEYLNIFKLDF